MLDDSVAVTSYRELVRQHLREDVMPVTFGLLFVYIGVAAIALFVLRSRSRRRDLALFWFSLTSLFFGIRLLATANSLPFITGTSSEGWDYLRSVITYGMPLLPLLFVREVFPEWRRVLTRIAWFQALFAAVGLLSDGLRHAPESLHTLNNVIVLAYAAISVVVLFRHRRPSAAIRILQIALLATLTTVVMTNLSSLGLYQQAFDPEPIGFFVSLGALAWLIALRTLENEERLLAIDRDLEVARRIQSFILPRKLPSSPRVRMAARYLPMASVAGDMYDVLVAGPDQLGILIADVSGHGVPAALIASMVKVAAQAQLPHAGDPARVLAGINNAISGNIKGQFVTAAYAFLDLQAMSLCYASAGHPPLLQLSRVGTAVAAADAKGFALGLRAKAAYQCVQLPVTGGERLLLYTDGLIESMNPAKEQFGEHRLRETLAASRTLDPEDCCTALLDSLAAWSQYGGDRLQEDDLTLLVVDILPAPAGLD